MVSPNTSSADDAYTDGKTSGKSVPIAITGIGCRLPGARSPGEFWSLLCAGRDVIREIPSARFEIGSYHNMTPANSEQEIGRIAGHLDDIDAFDAAFFGVSAREATQMDPQQRILLEVAWEALEDAGETPATLAGSRTGVFIGQIGSDYWDMQSGNNDLDIYGIAGSVCHAATSGRLSFAFDLRGPSMTLDSACSSALLAVHLACESLLSGRAELALAGAANLILSPEVTGAFSRAQMLAADGRCKFADTQADGFVRSEGIAAVALKTLPAALAHGDQIYALILGSLTNNDGRCSGQLMTPSRASQEELLRSAYEQSNIDPAAVDYLEAHGTGTAVGDPVELQAAAAVLGSGRSASASCLVGSVKTNIGHTEAAAGLAGLIKAALCLKHRLIPASLHFHDPTAAIDWETSGLAVPRELTPLPDRGRPAIAGVSSFGITGTNVHVVLGEVEPTEQPARREPAPGPHLLTLSARSLEALREMAGSYAAYLGPDGTGRAEALRDICYSAATRRAHWENRLAIVGNTHDEFTERLTHYLAGDDSGAATVGHDVIGSNPRVAFVFPGQGSQWVGMGRELLGSCPPFADVMRECDTAIGRETGWSVIEKLNEENPSRFAELDILQPTLWAVEVALAQTWRSWGIEPAVVVGHSMGETAAACVAGALTVSDAAAVICRRSRIANKLAGQGAMALVNLPADEIMFIIRGRAGQIAVAAINSPASTVLSGESAAIDEVVAQLESTGVFCRRLDVAFASHGPMTDGLLDELMQSLTDLHPTSGSIPIHSTVRDARIDGSVLDGAYWARNLRDPVLFSSAIRDVAQEAETIFLEISPHPVLVMAMAECLRSFDLPGVAYESLRRAEPERASLLATLGRLYTSGYEPAWHQVNDDPAAFVRLPTYPWQRERYWIDKVRRPDHEPAVEPATKGNPLLGARIMTDLVAGRYVYEGRIDRTINAYLDDHRVDGIVILPGTAYIEIATTAANDAFGHTDPVAVTGIDYRTPLFLRDGERPQLRVTLTRGREDNWDLEISSRYQETEPWILHATGAIGIPTVEREPEPVNQIRERCGRHIIGKEFYDRFREFGNEWRERFQAIAEAWRGEGEALARLHCPASIVRELDRYRFHPALLDACGQALAATLPMDTVATRDGAFVLSKIEMARILRAPGSELWSHARIIPSARADSFMGDIAIVDDNDTLIAELRGLQIKYLGDGRAERARPNGAPSADFHDWLYVPRWQRVDRTARELPSDGAWLVLGDSTGVGDSLRKRLEAAGQICVTATAAWSYSRQGPRYYRVNPGSTEDLGRVLNEGLADTGAADWQGVIHLWNLDVSTDDIPTAQFLGCRSVVRLVQAVPPGIDVRRLWLVARGSQAVACTDSVNPAQAAVWGLGRTISCEHPELRSTLVDLSPEGDATDAAAELWEELWSGDGEDQVALRNRERFAARLVRHTMAGAGEDEDPGTDATLLERTTVRVGIPASDLLPDVDLLSSERTRPGPGEVEIEVAYGGGNFTDALLALGMRPGQRPESAVLGWECAGRVSGLGDGVSGLTIGDEVVSLGCGGLSRYMIAKSSLVFRKPARLSLAEAATLPIAFLSAYYALKEVARISVGERVLIHSAAGGVGLAAVQVARWRGAEVFATAGSDEKRSALTVLGVRHISDSRSFGFVDHVRDATGGEGVDVVLNTIADWAVEANLALLAPYGRYLELARRNIFKDNRIGLALFSRNLLFSAVDVIHMIQQEPHRAAQVLTEVFDLVASGTLHPLPYRSFPVEHAATAFQQVAQAKHIGKILLAFDDVAAAATARRQGSSRVAVASDATYLITGGLGDLGMTISRRLVQQGARHLLLVGRSSLPLGDAPADARHAASVRALRELEQVGAEVIYESLDVADEAALRDMLEHYKYAGGPAIRGVVHAAGVVRLAPVTDLTDAQLDEMLGPKTRGAWNLHRVLADEPLDFFVLFSSASSLIGSPLLGAYAAGNAFMDALSHHRRRSGQPVTCINWGFWSSVGMVARIQADQGRSLASAGIREFTPDEGVAAFEALLTDAATQVMVMPVDWERWKAAHSEAAKSPQLRELVERPATATEPTADADDVGLASSPADLTPAAISRPIPVTGQFTQIASGVEMPSPAKSKRTEPRRVSADSSAIATQGRISIDQYLMEQIAKVTGTSIRKLNSRLPLDRQGLDSLMANEVRNRIYKDLGVVLSPMALLGGRTLAHVAEDVSRLMADQEFPS